MDCVTNSENLASASRKLFFVFHQFINILQLISIKKNCIRPNGDRNLPQLLRKPRTFLCFYQFINIFHLISINFFSISPNGEKKLASAITQLRIFLPKYMTTRSALSLEAKKMVNSSPPPFFCDKAVHTAPWWELKKLINSTYLLNRVDVFYLHAGTTIIFCNLQFITFCFVFNKNHYFLIKNEQSYTKN